MNILVGTILLWAAAVLIWRKLETASRRHQAMLGAMSTLKFTVPRMITALTSAAFITELLPRDHMESLFGTGSGAIGIGIAILLGPVTPGGAFVSYAIGAAALNSGAALAPVIAYVTSWSLFSATRLLAYELPVMGRAPTWWRLAVSLPVPLIVGAGAALIR